MPRLDLGALVDDIDAAIFTGDYLQDAHNREFLKDYCASWLREIERVADACDTAEHGAAADLLAEEF